MNKIDFLRRLDRELSVLDSEERKELLDFYEERFHSGKIYENKTEQEIIADLESPEIIAKNILAEYGVSPKFVKTKAERYSNVDTTQLVMIIIFDVLVTSWLIPTLFSVAFSLFASLISYVGAIPIILGNPTGADINFFLLITAVYFLIFMFALVVLDFSILITKKIVIWHLNVFKTKNREKTIKKLNKTSIEGWVKKKKKLSILKTLLIVGSFAVIFVTGAKLLFSEPNYLDTFVNGPKITDTYQEDVSLDITNSAPWKLTTDFDSMDIEIIEVSGDEIIVIHKYEQDHDFEISIDEAANMITIENKVNRHFVTSFKSFLTLFGITDKIIIEVPEGLLFSEVDLNTSNGIVSIKDITTDKLDVQTLNGSIIIKDLIATSDYNLSTSNGDVVLEDIAAPGFELNAHTSNGNIKVTRTHFDEYDLDSSNGDIILKDLNVLFKDGVKLLADTSNGELVLTNVYIKNVDIDTSNGDIYYNNEDTSFDHNSYKKSTSNGDLEGNQN